MAEDDPVYVEALAVRNGKIDFVGTKDEAIKVAGEEAGQIDLGGKTLLPGFIDAHGHMVYFGKNLMDQSLTGVKDIAELVQRMK
jgi:predicted amidohydrolase YtcJ